MNKYILFLLISLGIGSLATASTQCDYGGIQTELRNAADGLHSGNPVRYIDFANDAPFSDALNRMSEVGVSNERVQMAWARAIRQLCGEKAENISSASVGPKQTLSGLSKLLGITP